MLQKLQWDSLQQRRACSRVPMQMLYRICSGLVVIPASIYLQPTVVHTRGFETSYRQIQCNTSMYNQTFFPSAIRLWNTLPPDSFKAQLNTTQLIQLPTGHVFNGTTALFLWPPYVIGQANIFLYFSSNSFSSPNLSGRRLDVYDTSTHGVDLVRI